ncbi:hypothetical protein [Sphingobium boeckii]|uniref:Uncharacterized protein n=1 Tax=Sphingobium boeckii TaxID=1082345 RepID=A0A7W9AEQ2_9SPHN|nr:hypothetical protein [Sphingobium boeckii]MBB5684284.1 hypothetical protein [Sphingobium boeckii]
MLTELDGPPGDYDVMQDGALVERTEQRIDDEYRSEYGPDAITLAHMRKAIEARLIVAGYEFEGLLTAEAQATGQSVTDLAAIIIAKDEPIASKETARVADKAAWRALA